MGTEVGRLALVDQWERTATAFGRPPDDAAYAGLQAMSARGPWYAAGMAVLTVAGLTTAAAGVTFALLRSRGGSFRQTLSVASHAAVILALRQVIAAPATYLRETTSGVTSLGLWFPGLDEATPVARLLGGLDLFVLWWAVVIGIGLAAVFRLPARRTVVASLGVYVSVVVVLTVAMLATGGRT
jgi:hypothetical protein